MIPSRRDNPFATCWIRPGVIPFHFAAGESPESIVSRLKENDWQGAIVGPHGSGKSTLLATLAPLLVAAERPVCIVDGYEQLRLVARWRLAYRCRRLNHGLLITSHLPTRLPTLFELRPDLAFVQSLVASFDVKLVAPADVAGCFARRKGNVREILFDLYDLVEHRRRAMASSPPTVRASGRVRVNEAAGRRVIIVNSALP